MKRIAVKLLVFLLLGAVVNVAVAWGCTAFIDIGTHELAVDYYYERVRTKSQRFRTHDLMIYTMPGVKFLDSHKDPDPYEFPPNGDTIASDHCPSWAGLDEPRLETLTAHRLDAVDARGWPCVALFCKFTDRGYTLDTEPEGAIDIGIPPWEPGDPWELFPRYRHLPIRPIWWGIVFNTIFYAAILWLVFVAPFAIRRWRRVRQGLCPKCAYPVGESDVCTECGRSVSVARRRAIVEHG